MHLSPLGFAACQSKKCTNIKSSHRFHRIHRSLLLRRDSHRIHRSLLLGRDSHRIHRFHRSLLLRRDSHRFHRSLLLRRNSHRIHRIHRSLLLRRNSHRIHRFHRSLLLRRDSHRIHRSLLLGRDSHRIHRIHRSLLLRRNSHRELSGGALVSSAPINNRLLIGWCTSCSGKRQSRAETSAPPGRRKFIVEKKLPQISRIYTDVSKMFCVFREFCGSKYLCKSVKSVGEYSLPVCSVNSVNSVGGFNIGALLGWCT